MPTSELFHSEFERALASRLQAADEIQRDHEDMQSNMSVAINLVDPNRATDAHDDEQEFDIVQTRRDLVQTAAGNFWVTGNVILSECPDCGAPMTIRSWLKLADCWRCETSTRLTQTEIDAIEQLTQPDQHIAPADDQAHTPSPQTESPAAESIFIHEPASDDTTELSELERLTRQSVAAGILRRGFSAIPAWLLSFLFHLLLILLLALFVFNSTADIPTITLSSFVSNHDREGGEVRIENAEHSLVDDLVMANDLEVDEKEIRDVLQKAQADAAELIETETPLAEQPDIDEVKKNITTSRDQLMSFAARDPRVRSEIVTQEGGTSLTEAAVARGLRWLASVQNNDGSWSLADYDDADEPDNEGDAAGTSLALLPFLGAGQTHESGIYRETVAKGLRWLIEGQKSNGDLRINFPGQAGMYAHGQATIVLCEALAMTGDQRFKDPAERAIRFIEDAQHGRGGWRYRPGQVGDTSVLGWQLMALQSARAGNLGIDVDASTFKLADYFLDQAIYRRRHRTGNKANLPTGSLYTYQPGKGDASHVMTAEAILCRMYLGWEKDDPRVIEAIRWLIEHNMPTTRDKNVYYWYYATQVMHHFGGEVWELWNRRMREILVAGQVKSGSRAGSWSPKRYKWGTHGGRIYVTSLSVCTLEVYYRHLPIFKQLELQDQSPVSVRPRRR